MARRAPPRRRRNKEAASGGGGRGACAGSGSVAPEEDAAALGKVAARHDVDKGGNVVGDGLDAANEAAGAVDGVEGARLAGGGGGEAVEDGGGVGEHGDDALHCVLVAPAVSAEERTASRLCSWQRRASFSAMHAPPRACIMVPAARCPAARWPRCQRRLPAPSRQPLRLPQREALQDGRQDGAARVGGGSKDYPQPCHDSPVPTCGGAIARGGARATHGLRRVPKGGRQGTEGSARHAARP